MMEPLDLRRGYDRWAASYDDADPSTRLDEPWLVAHCGDVRDKWVLDLGCGTGRYARLLTRRGAQVVGLDLSAAMLRRAVREYDAAAGRWVQADVERLPLADQAFDVVVSGLVLDHVRSLAAFFGEAARVLRPGGRLVVSAVHPAVQRLTGAAVGFEAGGRRYRVPGTIHEVEAVLAAAGAAGLAVTERAEPRVDERMVDRRPAWRDRLSRPGLLMLAATRLHCEADG